MDDPGHPLPLTTALLLLGREIVLALVKVLNHLVIRFGVLTGEKCTGDPAGGWGRFRSLRKGT